MVIRKNEDHTRSVKGLEWRTPANGATGGKGFSADVENWADPPPGIKTAPGGNGRGNEKRIDDQINARMPSIGARSTQDARR
jgi:hypothetical protein